MTTEEATTETTSATPAADPMQAGITHLREIDPTALRVWTVKGPKGVGGRIGRAVGRIRHDQHR
jgi:hypothetical protein